MHAAACLLLWTGVNGEREGRARTREKNGGLGDRDEGTPARGGGEGGATKVLSLEAPPRGPTPYLFIYHFSQKEHPFRIPSIKKWYPFHIPTEKH